VPVGLALALGGCALFTLVAGVYPQPFIRLAEIALFPAGG
jgi:hypothetical protein